MWIDEVAEELCIDRKAVSFFVRHKVLHPTYVRAPKAKHRRMWFDPAQIEYARLEGLCRRCAVCTKPLLEEEHHVLGEEFGYLTKPVSHELCNKLLETRLMDILKTKHGREAQIKVKKKTLFDMSYDEWLESGEVEHPWAEEVFVMGDEDIA